MRKHNEQAGPMAGNVIALWLEFILLFGGTPLLILYFRQRLLMLAILWCGAMAIHFMLKYRHGIRHAEEWNWDGFRAGLKPVLKRFALIAPLCALAVWWLAPAAFLSFPLQRPGFWLLVMALYPVLSVWPQELIYRSFLFYRYRAIFGAGAGYVAASALAFGYAHLIFLNGLAPAMTVAGGALFADSYRRNRSLALACLEHALYGCLVFTLGIGRYFFTGAAWRAG